MVLTETLAKKAFGNEDPIGKTIQISDIDFTVTGVIKDIPANSHLQFDYAFPSINMAEFRESKFDSWSYSQFATYIELAENADSRALSDKISNIVSKHIPESKKVISLQSLNDIHLRSKGINTWQIEYSPQGNITYVYIFTFNGFAHPRSGLYQFYESRDSSGKHQNEGSWFTQGGWCRKERHFSNSLWGNPSYFLF